MPEHGAYQWERIELNGFYLFINPVVFTPPNRWDAYEITAEQFVKEDYASKVKRGEVQVIDPVPPLKGHESESEIFFHNELVNTQANAINYIHSMDDRGGYYVATSADGLGHTGMSATHKLLVLNPNNWQLVQVHPLKGGEVLSEIKDKTETDSR